MSNIVEMNHPLIDYYLSVIRNKDTNNRDFKKGAGEISKILFYEASKKISTYEKEIETPVSNCRVKTFNENDLLIVPILRAGLSMSEAIMEVVPNAANGMIGLYRDSETKLPIEYMCKMPSDISSKKIFLVDPMLATGGSLNYAIKMLKERGARDITVLGIIASPEGIKKIEEENPDVDLYIASIDEYLNDNKYIVPGLGDAGDRIFGTDK